MANAPDNGSRPSILVVEDDVDIRDTLIAVLEDHGYAVRGAANGREGLDAVAAGEPSLVLLDLMMPVMTGAEFLVRLRGDATSRHIPVVLLSAWPKQPGMLAPDASLTKPVQLATLLATVERFCPAPRTSDEV